jgi:hypothetical protein
MIKQKTGYWKAHPFQKAIAVLVGFYLILVLSYYYVHALFLSDYYVPDVFVELGYSMY